MIAEAPAEELEIWRSQELTEALVRSIRVRRQQVLENMAGIARTSAPEWQLRVDGGRVAGYDDVLNMINSKGREND